LRARLCVTPGRQQLIDASLGFAKKNVRRKRTIGHTADAFEKRYHRDLPGLEARHQRVDAGPLRITFE
jgi:hypothetical protein